jgi:hypothetical protein
MYWTGRKSWTDLAQLSEVNRLGLRLLHKPVRPAKLRSLIRQLNMRGDIHPQGAATPNEK